jgi:hypothetical protein
MAGDPTAGMASLARRREELAALLELEWETELWSAVLEWGDRKESGGVGEMEEGVCVGTS